MRLAKSRDAIAGPNAIAINLNRMGDKNMPDLIQVKNGRQPHRLSTRWLLQVFLTTGSIPNNRRKSRPVNLASSGELAKKLPDPRLQRFDFPTYI
jgi:hypothetical protein